MAFHAVNSAFKSCRVIAFVGPAGTGKSQRAQMVAQENEMDFMIDDGLLISKGRIKAGRSAKSERNLVRAIRRALFHFPDHKEAVSSCLKRAAPFKIMIVATSLSMADKITRALELPSPERIIDITEVASPEEIINARRERQEKGQHVIPVSRTQLRKNFAGKLVGHLRGLFRSVDREEGERTIVRPPFTFFGTLSIETTAIEDLVSHVVSLAPQISTVKDIKVRSSEDEISLEITVNAAMGKLNLRELGTMQQKRVASAVRYFTGMDIGNVDIRFAEVLMP